MRNLFNKRKLASVLMLNSILLLTYNSFAQQLAPDKRSQIVLLGTGNPNAWSDRSGPASALIVNNTSYLIDFGPGVVRRASAASQKGIAALKAKNLKTAFLTHLHSDHTIGYPDLIFTPAVLERNAPLEVYGPKGLQKMTDHILIAYEEDIRVRIDGLEPAKPDGYIVNVHEIEEGLIYEDENVKVTAFAVHHGGWTYAYGFRFECPDRVIVFSGDCTPSDKLIEMSRGCDVLIHEVYSAEGFKRRSREWQRYHADAHTSTVELAAIANKVKPGLLILNHQLPMGETSDALLIEIRALYKGKVVYGRDLDVY